MDECNVDIPVAKEGSFVDDTDGVSVEGFNVEGSE